MMNQFKQVVECGALLTMSAVLPLIFASVILFRGAPNRAALRQRCKRDALNLICEDERMAYYEAQRLAARASVIERWASLCLTVVTQVTGCFIVRSLHPRLIAFIKSNEMSYRRKNIFRTKNSCWSKRQARAVFEKSFVYQENSRCKMLSALIGALWTNSRPMRPHDHCQTAAAKIKSLDRGIGL
jgi:hypothetical protein